MYIVFILLVNATFPIVAMTIHMEAAIPETMQLSYCLNLIKISALCSRLSYSLVGPVCEVEVANSGDVSDSNRLNLPPPPHPSLSSDYNGLYWPLLCRCQWVLPKWCDCLRQHRCLNRFNQWHWHLCHSYPGPYTCWRIFRGSIFIDH